MIHPWEAIKFIDPSAFHRAQKSGQNVSLSSTLVIETNEIPINNSTEGNLSMEETMLMKLSKIIRICMYWYIESTTVLNTASSIVL